MLPSSSRKDIQVLPFGKAARATLAVSSGISGIGWALSDMANLLLGLKFWCNLVCRSNFSLKGIRQRYPKPPHSKGSADLIYVHASNYGIELISTCFSKSAIRNPQSAISCAIFPGESLHYPQSP